MRARFLQDALRAGIAENIPIMQLRKLMGEDFMNMREDGINKAVAGMSSPEEVLRATQDVDEIGG